MEVAIPTFTKISSCSDEESIELRRGPWTLEEDSLLIHYIACHGEGRWNMLAKCSGLKRTGKSCRLRWLNYLKPDVKRGNLTPQEQLLILELHSKWGNRWSKIAQHLPGRTDNEIKNYWRTRVQKQAKHLKIDSNSTAFQELIRCLWMPRLLQKIQSSSPSSSSSSSYQNSGATRHQPLKNVSSALPQVPPQVHVDFECKKDFALENCNLGEPKNISSQIPHNLRCPTSPTFHVMASNSNCGHIETNEAFSSIMPNSTPAIEYFLDPTSDQNPLENCWIDYQMDDNLWNIDNFWQLGERNT